MTPQLPEPQPEAGAPHEQPHLSWQAGTQREEFDEAIARIHRAIERGEVYQVNFTEPFDGQAEVGTADTVADSLAFFHALRRSQPRAYAAWIDTGEDQALSVSPELFFDWRGGRIVTRPMKGTAARGISAEADAASAAALRESAKERAENVMIVDLLRNDLSRIAKSFSVQVEQLFEVEAWSTVWQMTSTVSARTNECTTLADVSQALFPCGSVTGAPKLSAMRLINQLEPQPRGVYCGAVGLVRPGGAATFNVPIRTVTMQGASASCGIGSGITIDAHPHGEWAEWRSKRAFLNRASAPFQVLETLRLKDGVPHNTIHHLLRMARTAAHFGFPFDRERVVTTLARIASSHLTGLWRIRLLLHAGGRLQTDVEPLSRSPDAIYLKLAPTPLEEAHSEFVCFKTTRREHYERFASTGGDVFDTILWNERGEITECTRGNLALRLGGRWVTPAARCGLLPRIERELLIAEGVLTEAVITRSDLGHGEKMAFVNSLRGWILAQLKVKPNR